MKDSYVDILENSS